MPILTEEEARKLAQSKFENVLSVGTYDKVRMDTQNRANELGGGRYFTVRIDSAEYDEKYGYWEPVEDPAVNEHGFFWFALLPADDPKRN